MEQFDAILDHNENNLGWDYFFQVPHDIAEKLFSLDHRRVLCNLPDGEVMHSALLSDGRGGWKVVVNQARRKRLGLVLGQKFPVSLEKDTSEFGMPICEEMVEVLHQVDGGMEHFMALTPGKRRTLIHFVGQVKNPDIRIRRALVVCNHLINNEGVIDFKLLSSEMKLANNKGNSYL